MSAPAKRQRPGPVKHITSFSNPIIREFKGLHLRKNRKRSGLFMAEGLKLVADALERGWPIHAMIYVKTAPTHEAAAKTAAQVRALGGLVLEVTPQILQKLSRKDNPQTVLGVFHEQTQPLKPPGANLSENGLWVGLDRVRDPGNLGTIVRTADAAGAKGVILIGDTVDPFSLEAVRASMGSIFHVGLIKTSETIFLKWRETFKGNIIGTHLHSKMDYRTMDYKRPLVILMGNEQQGLSQALSCTCDQLAHIPMSGAADSLNLAVSTGIMLFEARRFT